MPYRFATFVAARELWSPFLLEASLRGMRGSTALTLKQARAWVEGSRVAGDVDIEEV